MIGYDNIKPKRINIPKKIDKQNNKSITENKLKLFLLDNGFYEVINSSFSSAFTDKSILVDNPLDSNKKHLRTKLVNSLIENLLFNERRQKDSIKFFEISDVYFLNGNEIQKQKKICIIASGRVELNHLNFSKKIDEDYLIEMLKKILPNINVNVETISRKELKIKSKSKSKIVYIETNIENLLTNIDKINPISNFRGSVTHRPLKGWN